MSMESDRIDGEEALKSVVHEDGKPVIVSRWGFHIEELDGQKVLVASTKEELVAQLEKSTAHFADKAKAQLLDGTPMCGGVGPFNCFGYNGCHRCYAQYIGNGYYNCVCVG